MSFMDKKVDTCGAATKEEKTLSDVQLKEAVGGDTPGAVRRYEDDEACGDFVCTKCGGTASQHDVKGNGRGSTSVYTNVKGGWQEEWTHYRLDCNHCKYFNHISWATGECVKDCQ